MPRAPSPVVAPRPASRRSALLASVGVMVAAVLAGTAEAQNAAAPEPLSSDRPGLGDGAAVLAPGVVQVEAGAALLAGDGTGVALGQGLLRWGVAGFELRLLPNSWVLGGGGRGLQDLGVGVKVPLAGRGRPVAVVAGATLPTGSDEATAGDPTLFATGVWEEAVGERVTVALNLGYAAPAGDVADGTVALLVTPGLPLGGADGLSAYGGVAAYVGASEDLILEAGLARVVDVDTQVDVNVGLSVADGTSFLGVGFSRRWR